MTKLSKLLDQFNRANLTRHNLYCKRSRHFDKWTKSDAAKLKRARLNKNVVRKELTEYLKKCGLAVKWGTTNNILALIPKRVRDRDLQNKKRSRERYAKNEAIRTLNNLRIA